MKNVRRTSSFRQVVALLIILIVVSAWQPDKRRTIQSKNLHAAGQDTTIPKSSYPDQADLQLSLDSAMQQVNLALSKIDYAKINADVQKSLAQIDYNKINKEVNKAMKNIDWNQIKTDVSGALDSAKAAIDSIHWNDMKAEISKAQIEAKKAVAAQKINMDSIRIQVQKSLKDAQKSLQSARTELANDKALKTALEKNGLLQAGKPYSIQLKDGILYINKVKQSKAVTDKYSKYYSGKKNFTLSDDGGIDL